MSYAPVDQEKNIRNVTVAKINAFPHLDITSYGFIVYVVLQVRLDV